MIIWLYGADTFRSRQKMNEFKEKFRKDVDPAGHSLIELSGEDLDMDKFNAAFAAASLFARKRMIVVEGLFSAGKKELTRQIADRLLKADSAQADNIIIFWDELASGDKGGHKTDPLFKFLEKQKIKQEFKPMFATEAQDWVRQKSKEMGVQLRIDAARVLTALTGTDLWALDNEIRKLVHFKLGQGLAANAAEAVIEAADVEALVRGAADENIFALTDALSRKDKAGALARLQSEIEAGAADAYLMHMIIRQFRILLQVKQALDLGQSSRQIQNSLKLHPFVAQKAIGQVRNYSLLLLKDIFGKLARIDQRLKTGRSELKTDLSILISAL